MSKIIIDLDNTITIDSSSIEYSKKLPNLNIIQKLREYKQQGFEIIIYTARNMVTFEKDISKINAFTLPLIKEWLDAHNIPYDGIYVGKPFCGEDGFYVDDKAIRPDEFVQYSLKQIKKLLSNE